MTTEIETESSTMPRPDPGTEAVRRLFRRARKRPRADREAWVRANARDQGVASEVVSLLAHLDDIEADAPPADILLGQAFAGWTLLEIVGEGGSGRVYLAERDGVRGAFKLLHAKHSGTDGKAGHRVSIERSALERLSHPAIVRLLDHGTVEIDGTARDYLVTEFVEDAEPLFEGAMRDGLTVEQRIALLAEIAEAVGHAHAAGVVHRDLKPENIVLDGTGRPRILDFGIARLDAGSADDRDARAGSRATLAPEQIDPRRGPVTARTDVYALGVIGYRLVTGEAPYDVGTTLASAAQAILHVPAMDPCSIRRDIPPHAGHAIGHALAKEPSRRPMDAREFRERLAGRKPGQSRAITIAVASVTLVTVLILSLNASIARQPAQGELSKPTYPHDPSKENAMRLSTAATIAALSVSATSPALGDAGFPTIAPIKTLVVPGGCVDHGIAMCGTDVIFVRGSDRSIRVLRPVASDAWDEFPLPEQTSPSGTQYTAIFGEGSWLAVMFSNQTVGGDRVEMYERAASGDWTRKQTITSPTTGSFHYLMHADMDGDSMILVDRYADSYRGAGYVYRRGSTGTWTQEAKLQGASATPFYTEAVLGQIDDGRATLCAWLNPCGYSSASGRIYVFKRNPDSTWSQEADIRPSWATCGDSFGNLAALLHGQILNVLTPSTVWHRFNLIGGQWQQVSNVALPSDNQNGIRTRRTAWGGFSLRGTGSVWALALTGSQFSTLARLDPPSPYYNNSDGQFALGADGNRCVAFTGLDASSSLISIYDVSPLLDCNNDGISNADEIAAGAPDCNANGIPDSCEGSGEYVSPSKAPFGSGQILSHTFTSLPNAAQNVTLTVEIKADLGGVSEFVTVKADGTTLTTLFAIDGQDCPASAQSRTVTIPATQFNGFLTDGAVTIELVPSSLVSIKECPSSTAVVRIAYPEQIIDCDGNGQSDACQIAANPGLDKDGDGTLDGCNYAKGDFDLSDTIDGGDLAYLLALWGVSDPPVGDLNGDSTVNAIDLGRLLANWGPITP